MKLLEDNQWETESWGQEPSPLSKPQEQTQIDNVPLFFSLGTSRRLEQLIFWNKLVFFSLHFSTVIALDKSGQAEIIFSSPIKRLVLGVELK